MSPLGAGLAARANLVRSQGQNGAQPGPIWCAARQGRSGAQPGPIWCATRAKMVRSQPASQGQSGAQPGPIYLVRSQSQSGAISDARASIPPRHSIHSMLAIPLSQMGCELHPCGQHSWVWHPHRPAGRVSDVHRDCTLSPLW
jgi:hypothetical protein